MIRSTTPQTPEELSSTFGCVARVLSPRGVFVFDLQSEPSPGVNQVAYRCEDDASGWYQVHSYDRSTQIDCAHTVWPSGVERHRRRIFTPGEVARAAEDAGLVPADRFDGVLTRFLAAGAGRDFYALKLG